MKEEYYEMIDSKIESEIKEIFKRRFNIDLNKYKRCDFDKKLIGEFFKITPRDLIYLFFDIEKQFAISIPEECIAAGKFNSINDIIDIIEEQLKKKACSDNSYELSS